MVKELLVKKRIKVRHQGTKARNHHNKITQYNTQILS